MADKLLITLGTQVRTRRKALGMTQEELAERAGLSVDMIGRVERGQSGLLLEKLSAVAEALQTEAGALLGHDIRLEYLPEDRRAALNSVLAELAGLNAADLQWISRIIKLVLDRRG
jgi:transcriptional regulator with XRE-family HTH domain